MHGIALGRSQAPVNLHAWYTDAMMGAHRAAMTIVVGGFIPTAHYVNQNWHSSNERGQMFSK